MEPSVEINPAAQTTANVSQRNSVDEAFDKLVFLNRRDSTSVAMDTSSSSTSNNSLNNNSAPGLLGDLWQTQLALWTFTFSTVFTRLWQKRVRFVNSLVFAVGSIAIASVLSSILAFLVVTAHVFGKRLSSINGGASSSSSSSPSAAADSVVDGWISPRMQRSLSISSYCSGGDVRSRHSSGARSPICKNQPVFWERKMSMEQYYFGRLSRC